MYLPLIADITADQRSTAQVMDAASQAAASHLLSTIGGWLAIMVIIGIIIFFFKKLTNRTSTK
jgi:flagellar biogenesis protein FliO